MTAARKPSPYPYTTSDCVVACRGKVQHTLILAWDVAEPALVTMVLGKAEGAPTGGCRWVVDRQLLAAGMSGRVKDYGVLIWPARTNTDVDWTGIRPAPGVEPFLVLADRLAKFLTKTNFWVPIGAEVPFEVSVGRLLGRAA